MRHQVRITPNSPSVTTTTGCGNDWEAYDDHCYYWSNNTKTWYEAEAFCHQENGHLASITSDAINQYVLEGMNSRGFGSTWIGGNDIDEEGTWKWTDGSPFDFTFWDRGQPDNWGGNEHCMHHGFFGHWNDQSCSDSLTFLCRKTGAIMRGGRVIGNDIDTHIDITSKFYFVTMNL